MGHKRFEFSVVLCERVIGETGIKRDAKSIACARHVTCTPLLLSTMLSSGVVVVGWLSLLLMLISASHVLMLRFFGGLFDTAAASDRKRGGSDPELWKKSESMCCGDHSLDYHQKPTVMRERCEFGRSGSREGRGDGRLNAKYFHYSAQQHAIDKFSGSTTFHSCNAGLNAAHR